jgi:UDP-N-acetylmuramate--alanine ligase
MSSLAVMELLSRVGAEARALLGDEPARMIVVDVDRQRLYLVEQNRVIADYAVSTAVAGVGGEEGSLCTPPGLHLIERKVGDGEPLGAVFESRQPTGAVWRGEASGEDLVLTRILTLEGQEEGKNRGASCDSRARFIYIHGTNHEDALGRPSSHGCVRMANRDLLELYGRVEAGDPVVIA